MSSAAAYEIPKILTLNAGLKPSSVPTDDVLIKHAQDILQASASWQEGKTYQNIKTFVWEERPKTTKKSHRWYCLVARIKKDDISFDKMWSKVGRNQVWHQKSHLPSIAKATRIQYISETYSIWNMLVTLPPPLSPRVYTLCQASSLLEYSHNRRGIVVTLPIDLGSRSTEELAVVEDRGIRGRCVSIEHILEIDGGFFEWRKVACRDPGGMIPKFWAQKHMAHEMAEESISFLDWIGKSDGEDGHDSEEDISGG
ncbi:hypothetical protein BDN70DRAFT_276934 [Pholiota conissans]|uniref:DUF3074 domain-containing protein n=1 Tax=Pholiota conissans TaxID=109636 RepID=A0A9P6D532_9AGAR|nr:hypothetical protein BDN70DRAFT_276934 [Pholiota conissans]